MGVVRRMCMNNNRAPLNTITSQLDELWRDNGEI